MVHDALVHETHPDYLAARQVMRRILAGTATPARFIPFRPRTPARRG